MARQQQAIQRPCRASVVSAQQFLNTAHSPPVQLPVCLDRIFRTAVVHLDAGVAVWLPNMRHFLGLCGGHIHQPQLIPNYWAVSTSFPGFLSVWMAPLSCCTCRAKCGLTAGEQQTVLRAIPSLCALALPIPGALGCLQCLSWVSVLLDGFSAEYLGFLSVWMVLLLDMQGQVWPYGWPAAGYSLAKEIKCGFGSPFHRALSPLV